MSNSNIWQSLSKPIFIQAPMDDVTDTVFRQIIASCGKPDIFFTEFVSVESFCSKGKAKTLERLRYTKNETPIVAQIWGSREQKFYETARELSTMGFSGIDINMGCPQKDVLKTGGGAALIKKPQLAKKIIEATKKGAGNLPVSVKTRLGFDKIQTKEWLGFLLEQKLDAITIHLRTVKEMSKVEAHWEEMETVQTLRHRICPETRIIGNGDVKSRHDGVEKCKKYKCDGVMIGRGMLQNPWVFNPNINPTEIPAEDKLRMLIKHLELFEKTWGGKRDWNALKKFYKVYVSGFENASEVRLEMMKLKNPKETIKYLSKLCYDVTPARLWRVAW